MKLFLKVLFCIFTMIITVEEAQSSTVINVLQEGTSYSFLQEPHIPFVFANNSENSCLNKENVVTCSEQVISINGSAAKGGTQLSTRFVSTSKGVTDLQPTLNRIASGGKFPHRNDGSIFKNMEGLLPKQNVGFYQEFVHPTPGLTGPGPMRIVTGQNGNMWFTPDHYKTFIPIR